MEVAIVTIASGMAYGAEPAPVPPAGVGAAARKPAAGTSASVQKSAVGTSASARQSAAGERMNRVSQFGDEAEESAGAPESSAREGGYSMQDLEDIWNNVADRISGDRPALSAATNGVVLTGISDDQFRLQVTNGMAGHLLKQNREYIMDLMEKETGRRRSMVLRDPADSAEPEGGNRDEKLRDLAKGASEILGVDVDVR